MVYFIPCDKYDDVSNVASLFIENVVKIHGFPKTIISDRDSRFLSLIWRLLWGRLGTKLFFSTLCHPQTDGQIEVMNRTLGSMLHAIVNEKWPLIRIMYHSSSFLTIGVFTWLHVWLLLNFFRILTPKPIGSHPSI